MRAISGDLFRRLPHAAWLVLVWVALWAELTLANVLSGVLVAGGVLAVFGHAGPRPSGGIRVLAVLRYGLYFTRKLVQSSAIVAWEVMTPRSHIVEGVIAVSLQGVSDAVVTLIANSISLTPGTLTLEVEADRDAAVLYVHVLHLTDIDEVRRELQYLGYLAIQAFGSPGARAQQTDPRQVGPVAGSEGGP